MLELLKTKKRILGRVKWFNSKLGYGFITHRNRVEDVDVDVFVHWSNLQLSEKEYHTLYKGEFVEFEIESCLCNTNSNGGIQACKVSGPNNGQLLTSIKDSMPHINNIHKYSQIYSVKQLEISDFTNNEHISPKARELYLSTIN
jgi:cold shock CspA family protein|tara:strand:+ start:2612 stop:3043 length:432 start_codon:yes stop_codon:yes gene_type:complete